MIQVTDLTMRYGSFRALDGVSFQVRRGEILGLLGPNGAGKSTTLKLLTTFLAPSSGRITVDGIDAAADPIAVRRRIGYLPETVPLYQDMPVSDYLRFTGSARGLFGAALKTRLEYVIQATDLKPVFQQPIHELSKGYRQRVGLAQALIHDPAILILDEPTSGLDPLQILGIRDLIRKLAGSKTVLFSTHILQEVSAIADRILIINRGRIVAEGTADELTRRAMGQRRLRVTLRAGLNEALKALQAVPGVKSVRSLEHAGDGLTPIEITADFSDAGLWERLDSALKAGAWPLKELREQAYSLEETFIELIRKGA